MRRRWASVRYARKADLSEVGVRSDFEILRSRGKRKAKRRISRAFSK